jgi:hypothetical protein
MNKQINQLSVEDFAVFLGTSCDQISDSIKNLITQSQFQYQALQGSEREQVILQVLKDIDLKDFAKVGIPERQKTWEMAWSDHLNEFATKGFAQEELDPKFMRSNEIVRLKKNYVKPLVPNFELNYAKVCKTWLFEKYLMEVDSVYEFGCGSGFNLVMLAKLYPHKKIYGLDWAYSSVNLVNINAQKHGFNITGRQFNFLEPDEQLELENNSAFLTVAALEQVGKNHDKFINFILSKSPKLVINLEPIAEYYDSDNLVDYLALMYHKKRGYLDGYLAKLKELELNNKIKIIKAEPSDFGSLYHSPYSMLVWIPLS